MADDRDEQKRDFALFAASASARARRRFLLDLLVIGYVGIQRDEAAIRQLLRRNSRVRPSGVAVARRRRVLPAPWRCGARPRPRDRRCGRTGRWRPVPGEPPPSACRRAGCLPGHRRAAETGCSIPPGRDGRRTSKRRPPCPPASPPDARPWRSPGTGPLPVAHWRRRDAAVLGHRPLPLAGQAGSVDQSSNARPASSALMQAAKISASRRHVAAGRMASFSSMATTSTSGRPGMRR